MAITAQNTGKTFELVPAGNHIARCFSMIEIGTVTEEIKGKLTKLYKVRVTWELPLEQKVFDEAKGSQPFSISKEYTLSMNEKANLRKDLESWRGRGFTEDEAKAFDITKLLGVACMLNVIHKTSQAGNPYAAISGVTPIPKGVTCPPQINSMFVLSYDDDKWEAKFGTLSQYVKERIEKTPEFQKRLNAGHTDLVEEPVNGQDTSDDLPF